MEGRGRGRQHQHNYIALKALRGNFRPIKLILLICSWSNISSSGMHTRSTESSPRPDEPLPGGRVAGWRSASTVSDGSDRDGERSDKDSSQPLCRPLRLPQLDMHVDVDLSKESRKYWVAGRQVLIDKSNAF